MKTNVTTGIPQYIASAIMSDSEDYKRNDISAETLGYSMGTSKKLD